MRITLRILFFSSLIAVLKSTSIGSRNENRNSFPVAIVHINDFHARFEQTNLLSNACKEEEEDTCIGGYARMVTVVKELMAKHEADNKNPIFLNAGDSFQGSIWYNVLRWNVTTHFLNLLPADAMTLGNHEFDHGIEGLVPFLETINSPMIVANIDDSEEPSMQGLYNKSLVIDKYGRQIGIIGVIIKTSDELSNTEQLKFLDEVETVRAEAQQMHDDGIDIIIVLSHAGINTDRVIAREAGPYIDVIVGGHSHTFLYNGTSPGPDMPADTYPVIEFQDDGRAVYIVQASAFAKYVGDLTVWFDENGDVEDVSGNPIYLSNNVAQDPDTVKELAPWKIEVDKYGNVIHGETRVQLDTFNCNQRECLLGNLIADSMVHSFIDKAGHDEWTYASIGLQHRGGIRSSLAVGDLRYADLVGVVPFENLLYAFDIRGDKLISALEYSVSEGGPTHRNMLQVSGLKVTYDMNRGANSRIISVRALCNACSIPTYEPLDPFKYYRVVATSFLADGGDGFTMFKEYGINREVGAIDIDAFTDYVKRSTPIMATLEQRITFA